MTPFFIAFCYMVTWSVTVFFVLPFMRGRSFWLGVLINTLLAGMVTAAIYYMITNEIVPLRHVYGDPWQ